VSGLAKQCHGLDALKAIVERDSGVSDPGDTSEDESTPDDKDAFCQPAEILSPNELEAVRKRGGNMHRSQTLHREWTGISDGANGQANWSKPRVLIRDPDSPISKQGELNAANGHHSQDEAPESSTTAQPHPQIHNGRLTGIYENYLLVRPYPSLRILFTSPSMRLPGILQSPLLRRIGGSSRVRDELGQAFARGKGVTAKVRWISGNNTGPSMPKSSKPVQPNHALSHPLEVHLNGADDGFESDDPKQQNKGRPRWLHCTPLQGVQGTTQMVTLYTSPRSQWKDRSVDDCHHRR
jgi:hypothetical protein